MDWYLRKAAPNLPVRSGIPEATAQAEDAARVAGIESSRLRRRADIGAVAIFLAVLGLTWSLYGLINGVSARLDNGTPVSRTDYDELQKRVADLEYARASQIASPAPAATHKP